ncbi:hypothetical protein NKDENANG_00017 [Candidatus Entotheonellaceae bacterium PAL068K]
MNQTMFDDLVLVRDFAASFNRVLEFRLAKIVGASDFWLGQAEAAKVMLDDAPSQLFELARIAEMVVQ